MTEFEFDSTPETDAMLKQLCIKECFVRCKDCKYWNKLDKAMCCTRHIWVMQMNADDFCSKGEKR